MNVPEILDQIKAARKEQNISQQQIADMLEISQPAYRKIENGETELKVVHLFKILDFLGIKLQSEKDKTEDTYLPAKIETLEDLSKAFQNMATKDDIQELKELILSLMKGKDKEE